MSIDWITTIGTGVGSGVAVFGLLQFSVRRAIEKQFRELEERARHRGQLELRAAEHEVEHRLSIFPALDQLVYRAKLAVDEARRSGSLAGFTAPDLVDGCRELTIRLTGYRVYLDEEVFELVHDYKHALQDLVVIGDIATRPERLEAGQAAGVPPELEGVVDELHRRVEDLSGRIGEHLKARMRSLRGKL